MLIEEGRPSLKIIDFGSSNVLHEYIQSWYYRAPEVLMGLPYSNKIDVWSVGCIAAELYYGLPIMMGTNEED